MITKSPKLNRRSFLVGTAAVGGGLMLGLKIPFGAAVVRSEERRVGKECRSRWSPYH